MGFWNNHNKENQTTRAVSNIVKKDVSLSINKLAVPMKVKFNGLQYATLNGKEIMLDEEILNNLLRDISDSFARNTSKYFPLPESVYIEVGGKGPTNISDQNNDEKENEANLFNVTIPSVTFDDVYLDKSSKENIDDTITILKYKDKLFNEWKLGNKNGTRSVVLNFYGPSGTGKTMMAEAIGNYLGKKVLMVDYSQLESKYVGETPKNIKKVFEQAREQNAIVVFDEADSFLGKRLTNVTQSADYGVNVTRSVMLVELEKHDGIVIFTTNLIKNYDEAFKRRILASIEFKLPDIEGRKVLWKQYLGNNIPLAEDVDVDLLAKTFDEITGADIKDIILSAAIKALKRDGNNAFITYGYLCEAAMLIKKRYEKTNGITSVKTEEITAEQYKREMGNE